MNIFGVGPLELLFVFLIALVVLGPKDMAKTGRTVGRFMYKIVTSPAWKTFRQASKDLRQLPTKLMREAGLEEQELKKLTQEIGLKDVDQQINRLEGSLSSWTTTPQAEEPKTIAPPATVESEPAATTQPSEGSPPTLSETSFSEPVAADAADEPERSQTETDPSLESRT